MRSALVALGLLAACSDGPPRLRINVAVVSATGGDPLTDADFEEVTVEVAQQDRPVTRVTRRLDGAFDLPIEIGSLSASTRVRVHLDGPEPWVGAPPQFVPLAAAGLVRVVVGPAGRCAIVPEAELPEATEEPAMARVETFALVAGGRGASGPSTSVGFVDLVRFFSGDLDPLTLGSGAGRAATLGFERAVVVTEGGALLYDLANADARNTPLAPVHDGAGPASAVIARPGGAVVVGGEEGGAAVPGVTWVFEDGRALDSLLVVPRRRAAAVALGNFVVVAGGSEAGPIAEVLNASTQESAPVEYDDGVRLDPLLVRDGDSLWLIGGVGADGTVRQDTVQLLGCPSACRAEPGPPWSTARAGAVVEGGYIVGGDTRVEVAAFRAGVWTLEHAFDLQVARRDPLAVVFESGVLVVVAGSDEAGARRDVELCWPTALVPF